MMERLNYGYYVLETKDLRTGKALSTVDLPYILANDTVDVMQQQCDEMVRGFIEKVEDQRYRNHAATLTHYPSHDSQWLLKRTEFSIRKKFTTLPMLDVQTLWFSGVSLKFMGAKGRWPALAAYVKQEQERVQQQVNRLRVLTDLVKGRSK